MRLLRNVQVAQISHSRSWLELIGQSKVHYRPVSELRTFRSRMASKQMAPTDSSRKRHLRQYTSAYFYAKSFSDR